MKTISLTLVAFAAFILAMPAPVDTPPNPRHRQKQDPSMLNTANILLLDHHHPSHFVKSGIRLLAPKKLVPSHILS